MDIRFGIDIPTSILHDPIAIAQEAEALGFDFVSANDHPCGTAPNRETWTMLTWIAANTQRIHVASRVLGMPYRPPPMVAKMAATLDELSGGRLILGLGGGASDDEFRAFGLHVPTPRQKVQGLREATTIMRGLWTEPNFTFAGELFHTAAANLEPKPSRQIPIWFGTFGERALALTGELADGWIPSYDMVPPERAVKMMETIARGADRAGRNPEDIECVYNIEFSVGIATGSDETLSGEPQRIAEQLRRFAGLGFRAFNFIPSGPDRRDQVRRLAEEVIPLVE